MRAQTTAAREQEEFPTPPVFSIIEILEQILSHLPPLDIIRCQLVDKTWRTIITSSPLLQYKAWLRNDYPDASQHPKTSDYIPDYHWKMWTGDICDMEGKAKFEKEYNARQFDTNVERHLNPIIAARLSAVAPKDNPHSGFRPMKYDYEEGEKWGGYLHYTPALMRALRQWYDKHKDTRHIWAHISLYRPETRMVEWQTPTSQHAGVYQRFEARGSDQLGRRSIYDDFICNKSAGQPVFLTVGDVMARLEESWGKWIEAENEEHYLSHDGEGCDLFQGIPPESCLIGSDSEDGEDYEDDEEEDEDEDAIDAKEEKRRLREALEGLSEEEINERMDMEMEGYIDSALELASYG